MRTLPRVVSTLTFAGLMAACGGGQEDTGPGNVGAAADSGVAGDPGIATTKITIALQDDTLIVVTPDSIDVPRGAKVEWASSPDVAWVVAFPGSTPFQNGRRVFFGGTQGGPESHGPIPPSAPLGANKYTVFYPNSDTTYVMKDPKLVVVNDDGMGTDTIM